MRKIIRGRVYDTDTASLVGGGLAGLELYRKKTGEYFMYDLKAKRPIQPLDFAEARSWAEKSLDKDVYSTHFEPGACSSDSGMERMVVILPTAVKQALDLKSSETGKTFAELIAGWLGF